MRNNFRLKLAGLTAALSLSIMLTGCGGGKKADESKETEAGTAATEAAATGVTEKTGETDPDEDALVEEITQAVEGIRRKAEINDYRLVMAENGAEGYYEDDRLCMLLAPVGAGELNYQRTYFLKNGELISAQYLSSYAIYAYLQGENVRKITYYPSAGDTKFYSYDSEAEWKEWPQTIAEDYEYLKKLLDETEKKKKNEEAEKQPEKEPDQEKNTEKTQAPDMAESEYLLPNSDSVYIDRSNLEGFTKEDCRIARNEIYARHGRIFKDSALQEYFESKSWYTGTVAGSNFNENVLNNYETANIKTIQAYEKEMGWR